MRGAERLNVSTGVCSVHCDTRQSKLGTHRPQAEFPTGGGESPGESAAENPPTARKGDLACDIAAVVVSCCEGTTEQTAQTATGCARVPSHATRRSTIGRAPDRALVPAAGQL